MIPLGGYMTEPGEIELCPGRPRRDLRVVNRGDRPIQVGSHFHFAEANPALDFDRQKAMGFRLDIPSGTAIRFEPGLTITVTLVAFGGLKTLRGFQTAVPDGEGTIEHEH